MQQINQGHYSSVVQVVNWYGEQEKERQQYRIYRSTFSNAFVRLQHSQEEFDQLINSHWYRITRSLSERNVLEKLQCENQAEAWRLQRPHVQCPTSAVTRSRDHRGRLVISYFRMFHFLLWHPRAMKWSCSTSPSLRNKWNTVYVDVSSRLRPAQSLNRILNVHQKKSFLIYLELEFFVSFHTV